MSRPYTPDLPALRWSRGDGYGLTDPRIERALERGVPGFILFGGEAAAAREAIRELEARAGRKLLFGADLERGAGQQFLGATQLPPLAALGALGDLDVLRAAGAMTGREALAIGVSWIFAPVADLSNEPENPIVGTRALGDDPPRVAEQVAAWIEGCRSSGAIPCVKHFPGHGRTLTDSHAGLPTVEVDAGVLEATDLLPFRRAIEAGVPSVMTAHVAYPALDSTGVPATRSAPIVDGLLRDRLGFDGVVVTDALIMEGAGGPSEAAVGALAAGVDALLYPPEDLDVAQAIHDALDRGEFTARVLDRGRRRVQALIDRIPSEPDEGGWGSARDQAQAVAWAMRCLQSPAGVGSEADSIDLTVVDDDLGGPYPPPSRARFAETLAECGVVSSGTDSALPLLCVYSEPRAWKGRAGLSPASRARIEEWASGSGSPSRAPGGLIVLFGGPRLRAQLPGDLPVLVAGGGEAVMQEAAARWIVGRVDGAGAST